jgi:DNA-binding NarL/FixJ family response regulator
MTRKSYIPKKLPAIPVEDMVRRYLAGEPMFIIGLDAKMSDYLVRWYLVEAGVQIRPKGNQKGERQKVLYRRPPRENLTWEQMRDRYVVDGLSLREIAEATGISYGTVRTELQAMGVTLRRWKGRGKP